MVRRALLRASPDDAELVIGPRFARTRWHRSENHEAKDRASSFDTRAKSAPRDDGI